MHTLQWFRALVLLGITAGSVHAATVGEKIFGMTAASSASTAAGISLVSFDSTTPGTITTIGNFSGVTAGQSLRSIDFRPSTGQLYALSSSAATAQLYTVNLSTAALTPVGTGFTLPSTNARVEIEFNPVADNIRVVGGAPTNNNSTLNPVTGSLIAQQTNLAWAAGDVLFGSIPSICGIAYSNNTSGASSTTLYGFDFITGALVRIGGVGGSPSPDLGQMTTINNPPAALSFNAGLGIDISGASGTLYETHDDPTGAAMNFYRRDLTTGAETLVGAYGSGLFIVDISVQPLAVPEPSTLLLGASAFFLIAGRKRFRRSAPASAH